MTGSFVCPICGYPQLPEAAYAPGGGGSFEICPSCGFQFGVTDDDRGETFDTWRATWVSRGMPWRSQGISPPADWDPRAQLGSLGLAE